MIFLKYPNYLRRTENCFHISEWVTYSKVFNKTNVSIQNECIYTDGVVIIFKIHQRTVRIGNITKSLKSDCHLNQIVSTTRDGSASKILNQFFNYISLLPYASGVIYLNVRSENDRAKKFYERNGMKLVDQTNWSEGKIKGDVYQIIVKKNGSQNLESFFPSFDASKIV